jgi:CheY-like chemotaxis protein
LVVEDDPAIGDLLVSIVKDAGCDAIHAEDGHSALRLARMVHPQIITLDLGLRGLDGRAVLRALKTDPATADISVIVISAFADQLDPQDRRAAFATLRKPFDIDHVIRVIERALHAA